MFGWAPLSTFTFRLAERWPQRKGEKEEAALCRKVWSQTYIWFLLEFWRIAIRLLLGQEKFVMPHVTL